jgi:hypothetical protein
MITVEKDGMQFRTKNSILAGINASSALSNAVFIERHGTALPSFELASVFVRLDHIAISNRLAVARLPKKLLIKQVRVHQQVDG